MYMKENPDGDEPEYIWDGTFIARKKKSTYDIYFKKGSR